MLAQCFRLGYSKNYEYTNKINDNILSFEDKKNVEQASYLKNKISTNNFHDFILQDLVKQKGFLSYDFYPFASQISFFIPKV